MADFLLGTTSLFGSPINIFIFIGALICGLVFGAIPGISGMTLAAIFLPYSVFLTMPQALIFYGTLYVSGVYSGGVTAILFNIPGDVEDAPTGFDGYPMTQKGMASKAVGLSVVCASLGGIVSAILMMVGTAPIARWAIRNISAIEMSGIIFFALAVVAGMGSKSIIRGWLSVLSGMLIGTIGMDPVGGISRFSFGNYYIMSGINFSALILGFFAITEVFVQSEQVLMGTATPPPVKFGFPTFQEFWKLKVAIVRSTVIGFLTGLLVGAGAAIAAFLSYSEAVRWSKHPDRFGTGEPEGVVASETAKNAATGGSMIHLLALGIPGGGFTAIMIGVFTLHNLEPGPLIMVREHAMVWVLFVSMFWASISIFVLGYMETKTAVHMLRIPQPILFSGIVLFSTIGAYALRNSILDVWTMFIAGVFGYFLRSYDYSLPGIIMGVVLGELGESAFYKAMVVLDYKPFSFFSNPIAGLMVGLGLLTIVYQVVRQSRKQRASSVVDNIRKRGAYEEDN